MIQNENMRQLGLLLFLIALAGCGGRADSKILGTWHVDSASVTTSRLAPGTQNKPDWTDATDTLGKVRVTFGDDGTVSAAGFGENATAKWKLVLNKIEIDTSGWPAMTFDQARNRIHLTQVKGNDTLQMDLIKS